MDEFDAFRSISCRYTYRYLDGNRPESLNSAVICVQEITVIDDQELVITCPDDVTKLADNGELFATGIDYGDEIGNPTLTENCHKSKIDIDYDTSG